MPMAAIILEDSWVTVRQHFSELESVRMHFKCLQDWKVSESESVRMDFWTKFRECQTCKVLDWESIRMWCFSFLQNGRLSESQGVRIGIFFAK